MCHAHTHTLTFLIHHFALPLQHRRHGRQTPRGRQHQQVPFNAWRRHQGAHEEGPEQHQGAEEFRPLQELQSYLAPEGLPRRQQQDRHARCHLTLGAPLQRDHVDTALRREGETDRQQRRGQRRRDQPHGFAPEAGGKIV